jgi:hypothetical protein
MERGGGVVVEVDHAAMIAGYRAGRKIAADGRGGHGAAACQCLMASKGWISIRMLSVRLSWMHQAINSSEATITRTESQVGNLRARRKPALATAGFGVFAVVEDGSSNRVVHHSDLPVFLGVLAAIFVVLGGIGLVYSLGAFAIKRGSKGGSLLALLALLFNLLITVGGIVAGIIIAVANSNDSDAVMAGIITAAVGLIATFLLGVLLVLLVFAMRSPKSSDPTPT